METICIKHIAGSASIKHIVVGNIFIKHSCGNWFYKTDTGN